ncbi:phage tail protein [Aeromonas hydrophila]|uniref:phage tail protein n=1 Tax=Aeromonas hydrophila TaxID=644 RepID=UPI001FC86085|nr:phage tail protein [Aeromonas hydrophila]GKQ96491.1 hypothetical protein KAM461_07410 [Aeromonas hydrophila]
MSAIYFAIPTHAGQAKIANAIALGIPLKITQMAVGDGNGQPVTPNPAQTTLVREQRRAPLNTLFQDPLNPAQLVAEQIIPETVGGWWIREVGLYDETGTLIAIANSPDTYKPQLSEGSGRTQTIRMVLIVSDTSAVELKIDPSVVLATRKYVEDKQADELAKLDNKQSVRVSTTVAITLSAAQTIDGVALAVGDRVLVKDQADAKQNGIYMVATQAWTRTTDADTGVKLTCGARVYVDEGNVNGGKVWYLATSGAITVGTTPLQFKDEHPAASETIKGVTRYATQSEVDDSVTANQKDDAVVTVKKLWAWVKQASESVLGMMKVATQAQTNAGTADDVAITPKKLRAGFAISTGANGYIAFPTWMSGLIIQWFSFTPTSTSQATLSFPIVFPNNFLAFLSGPAGSGGATIVRSGAITASTVQVTSSNTGQAHFIVVLGF